MLEEGGRPNEEERMKTSLKERDKIVAEKKASEATQKLNQFWYETAQAVVQSTFDIQNRSMQYMQDSIKDEIETLKDHMEASQHLLQTEKKSSNQKEAISSLVESGVEAYKLNVALMQRITEHGTETFKANAEVMRDLTQTLMKKTQDQQSQFL
jgi:hypothetical protein